MYRASRYSGKREARASVDEFGEARDRRAVALGFDTEAASGDESRAPEEARRG